MMSTAKPDSTSNSIAGMWATFYLDSEMFALRVEDVQEVMMHQPLTPIPLAPEHIVGLLNLRGQIMPAVDLRKRLQFDSRETLVAGNMLVLKTNEGLISVLVDRIGDVLELPAGDWRAPPETLAARHRTFVEAVCPIQDHLLLRLAVNAVIADDGLAPRQTAVPVE